MPLNYDVDDETHSRSDAWRVFDQDIKLRHTSSIIAIMQYDGDFILENNNFTSIIGRTGSVINVWDVYYDDTYFRFTNNIFSGNTAQHNYANILINKITNPSISSINACPQIIFEKNTVEKSANCLASPGNVHF